MKTSLQIMSWFAVVLGGLAIMGGFMAVDAYGNNTVDGFALFGGVLFLLQGVLSLTYINEKEGK